MRIPGPTSAIDADPAQLLVVVTEPPDDAVVATLQLTVIPGLARRRGCTLIQLTSDKRREDAIRYLTAQSKALRYALAHRDETIKLTAEATDAKPDDPRPPFVFDDAIKVGAIAPDLPLPMDKLAWMQQEMVELGQIPKAGDLAKMVNGDIRAQALERAGK